MTLDTLKEYVDDEISFDLNHRKSEDLGRIHPQISCKGAVSYILISIC